MVRLSNRRLIIDDKPTIVLSGEVHYFRLQKSEWRDRIQKTVDCGCNALASYIPWIIHEEIENEFDLTGRKRPENNLGEFIDLCHEAGLWFIARPGPFVMAEMRNEGIPFWVYEKCPEAIPTTWGGKKATSKNLSYNDADYLHYAERWYGHIMPVLAPRLQQHGGPIIGVQLDNEIGMLQCWTGQPDLSPDLLCRMSKWLHSRYSIPELKQRYPFDWNDPQVRAKAIWIPKDAYANQLRVDYNDFLRTDFAQYIATLRGFAEANGVRDVPFIVNIHGSGGGRAITFPIGISQSSESYTQGPGYLAASDHYLGDLTRQNAGDLLFLNAFMACVNRPEQPLASIEFEAGSGDYGDNGAVRYSQAAVDFKTRLSVIQGNRLINHYLLSGGHNPPLEQEARGLVANTGYRHGFAAPINPEGDLDPTYLATKRVNETISVVADKLADMDLEADVAIGFVPDYYATDVKHDGPISYAVTELEQARGFLESMTRHLALEGLTFSAVNLQASLPAEVHEIYLATSSMLGHDEQVRLLKFVQDGGRLMLYGRLPVRDFEAQPCTILIDGIGCRIESIVRSTPERQLMMTGDFAGRVDPYRMQGMGPIAIWEAQTFTGGTPLLHLTIPEKPQVAARFSVGKGSIVVLTTELSKALPIDLRQFHVQDQVNRLPEGLLVHRVKNEKGEGFLSLINLDDSPKSWQAHHSAGTFPTFVGPKEARLLPVNITIDGIHIQFASTEIVRRTRKSIVFRGGRQEVVSILNPVGVDFGDMETRKAPDGALHVLFEGSSREFSVSLTS